MEVISHHPQTHDLHALEVLPENRNEWPRDAERTYADVLRELDRWSREHGSSAVTNSWIAEEAVRRSW